MPLSVYRKLKLGEMKSTTMSLLLANRSIKHPKGILEDVLMKVDQFIFLVNIIVLDMEEDQKIPIILLEEDKKIPIILSWPFLAIGKTLIDG